MHAQPRRAHEGLQRPGPHRRGPHHPRRSRAGRGRRPSTGSADGDTRRRPAPDDDRRRGVPGVVASHDGAPARPDQVAGGIEAGHQLVRHAHCLSLPSNALETHVVRGRARGPAPHQANRARTSSSSVASYQSRSSASASVAAPSPRRREMTRCGSSERRHETHPADRLAVPAQDPGRVGVGDATTRRSPGSERAAADAATASEKAANSRSSRSRPAVRERRSSVTANASRGLVWSTSRAPPPRRGRPGPVSRSARRRGSPASGPPLLSSSRETTIDSASSSTSGIASRSALRP